MAVIFKTDVLTEAYDKAEKFGGIVKWGEYGFFELHHPTRKRKLKRDKGVVAVEKEPKKSRWADRKSRIQLRKTWFHDVKSNFINPNRIVMTREQYEAQERRQKEEQELLKTSN